MEVLTTLENSIMDVKKDCESKKRVSDTSVVWSLRAISYPEQCLFAG
jgi:hypothetical protein